MHYSDLEAPNPVLTQVRLYGHLRKRFGSVFKFAISTPAEAVRALCAVVPGFKAYLVKHSEPGYRIRVGPQPIEEVHDMHLPHQAQEVKIIPVVAGAKGGVGQIILGIVLIVAAVWTGGATLTLMGQTFAVGSMLANMGISLILGGIMTMIVGSPKPPTPPERPENKPSYAFNGAVNTTAQGNPVPLCYGRLRVGSQVIAIGMSAEDFIQATAQPEPPPTAPSPVLYYGYQDPDAGLENPRWWNGSEWIAGYYNDGGGD